MMGQNSQDMSNIGPVWMVPIITMITMSTSGSLFTRALLPSSHTAALISLAISATLLSIGLSFTMMFTTAFLLRLYLYGPLESRVVLTTFTTLTPLSQGGYSLLLNGKDLADLLPGAIRPDVPQSPLIGNIIYTLCFCGAYALWSMGLAWITIACFSILRRAATLPAFYISHWCVIVPNGVFAALSVQMSTVLNSPFFKVFGALWSCIVIFLWIAIFLRTIPALIDGSIFKPVSTAKSSNPLDTVKMPTPLPLVDEEKAIVTVKCLEVLQERNQSSESVADTLCSVKTGRQP
ncbi:hypothetical protein EIP86_005012 [Pleurotus ostreatoroseus]|nr:hypothetical protein EIP86_005012 [Pleurotus ostreatoroseus]